MDMGPSCRKVLKRALLPRHEGSVAHEGSVGGLNNKESYHVLHGARGLRVEGRY